MYLPYETRDYSKVVSMWLKFKRHNRLVINNHIIRTVFTFHNTHNHHAILYYSIGMDTCLLLCRFNGKYYNVLISADGFNLNLKEGSILLTFSDSSFV